MGEKAQKEKTKYAGVPAGYQHEKAALSTLDMLPSAASRGTRHTVLDQPALKADLTRGFTCSSKQAPFFPVQV